MGEAKRRGTYEERKANPTNIKSEKSKKYYYLALVKDGFLYLGNTRYKTVGKNKTIWRRT